MNVMQKIGWGSRWLRLVTALIALMLPLSVASAGEKIVLNCTGRELLLPSPLGSGYSPADRSVIIDLTTRLVNLDGRSFPMTESEGEVHFNVGDKKSWINGSVNRITGKALISEGNGKFITMDELKCSRTRPLF